MAERDDRPFLVLGGVLLVAALAFAVPASRAWLLGSMVEPLRSQAEREPGLSDGYSLPSLLLWAGVGGAFAWAAYEALFVRWRLEPDRAFFLGLAPALLLGPLLHAALVAGVLPAGSVVAYLASEPLVYLTITAYALVGLALGRLARRPLLAPLLWGLAGLAPVLWLLAPLLDAEGARLAGIMILLAAVPTALLAAAYLRFRKGDPAAAVVAVIGAHALDGASTWMVLRDPFGLGIGGFGERNPVSLGLVNLGNGWPYFALKLALPVALLAMVKVEESERRLRAFLLFAVFVLGFGPGMANLLQVVFGGAGA